MNRRPPSSYTSSPELGGLMRDILRHPILCQDAQIHHCRNIHLWEQITSGATPLPPHPTRSPELVRRRLERAAARSMDAMLRTNLRMVVSLAKNYQHQGLDLSDLIQEGSLGLMRGLQKFDPSRGYKLSTFVYWWIRQGITRGLHTKSRMIRLPINHHDTLSKIYKFVSTEELRTGRTPSDSAIADHLGKTLDQYTLLLSQIAQTNCASLDSFSAAHDDFTHLYDILPSPEPDPMERLLTQVSPDPNTSDSTPKKSLQLQALLLFLEELPERDAFILRSLYADNAPIKEVGRALDLSPSRIKQLHKTLIEKASLWLSVE